MGALPPEGPSGEGASVGAPVLSVALMFGRLVGAVRYAAGEEGFLAVFGAGIFLVVLGTVTYSLSQHWNLADAFYFAVCTLTTSSIADPHLTLTREPIKIFTALYVLIGIGILVEMVRQIGFGYVAMRAEHGAAKRAGAKHGDVDQ